MISARNIVPADCAAPPDTYVKCYLKDGDRLRHKKKTRVVRQAVEPIYKQTLKYQVNEKHFFFMDFVVDEIVVCIL